MFKPRGSVDYGLLISAKKRGQARPCVNYNVNLVRSANET